MPIDSALIGFWQNADGTMEFNSDGWLYSVDVLDYVVSPSGGELTLTTATGSTIFYMRETGTGTDLLGAWFLEVLKTDGVWRETVNYNSDGTYSAHWALDGALDKVWFGYYSPTNGKLTRRERRGYVSTDLPNIISVDRPYDVDLSGNYTISSEGVLTLTLNGQTTEHTLSQT